MFQVDQLHSDYFDNLNKVGNVVNYLFVIVQRQFLQFLQVWIRLLCKKKNDWFMVCE